MCKAAGVAAIVGFAGLTSMAPAYAQSAEALRARHDALKAQLSSSVFQRPLLLESNDQARTPRGDVYAVIDHPFRRVTDSLQSGRHWCELLILQTNIKRCVPTGNGGMMCQG